MTILDQLAAYARERVNEARRKQPFEELKKQALSLNVSARERFAFENALKKPGLSFICECKKASPSKGLIFHMSGLPGNMRRQGRMVSPSLPNPNGFWAVTDICARLQMP